jgi:hypothetical protein
MFRRQLHLGERLLSPCLPKIVERAALVGILIAADQPASSILVQYFAVLHEKLERACQRLLPFSCCPARKQALSGRTLEPIAPSIIVGGL